MSEQRPDDDSSESKLVASQRIRITKTQMPFPPMKAPFHPRAPFPRGGRRPQPSRHPGWKSAVSVKYPENGTATPANNSLPEQGPTTYDKHKIPHPPVAVQKHNEPAVISSPYNCSELLEALKSIQQVVQCCSCHKPLHSARTCASGHGLCWNCKNRCNRVCPLCNCAITDSKPIMLNNIIKLLPRRCNFSDKGCDGLVLASDMNHETFCRFRSVTCRIPSCAVKCTAKDLLRHLEDFHGKEMIRTASYSSILMNFNPRIEKDGLAVIVAYNNIIWQHTRSGNNCLLQFYQYVPMEKPKSKFSVVVNFYTPVDSYSATTPIHTDVFDPHQLFKDKETFCLPRKVSSSFSRFYGGVNYNFKIMREDL